MQFVIFGVFVVLSMAGMGMAYKAGEQSADARWKLIQARATQAKNRDLAAVLDVMAGRRARQDVTASNVSAEVAAAIASIPEPEPAVCEPTERIVQVPGAEVVKVETKRIAVGCDYPAGIRATINKLQVGK